MSSAPCSRTSRWTTWTTWVAPRCTGRRPKARPRCAATRVRSCPPTTISYSATRPSAARSTPQRRVHAMHAMQVVEMLLARGATLERASAAGRTPLLEACAIGDPATVAALLAAGADASVTDASGANALMITGADLGGGVTFAGAGARAAAVLRTVLEHATSGGTRLVDERDAAGDSPLVSVSRRGLPECCTVLLHAGAEADECDGAPLVGAALHGHVECAQILLEHGASAARMAARSHASALHAAASAGHSACLQLLLAHSRREDGGRERSSPGAALLQTDGAWRSPLLCAAAAGHGDCVDLLVAAGALVEQADREGNTPLLSACTSGDPKAVAVLLAAGAAPRHCNAAGDDGLMLAAMRGHLAILPLLLPACASRLPYAMVRAAAAGHTRTAVALVELCPLPPLGEEQGLELRKVRTGVEAEAACAQMLQAVWRRTVEEHAALAGAISSEISDGISGGISDGTSGGISRQQSASERRPAEVPTAKETTRPTGTATGTAAVAAPRAVADVMPPPMGAALAGLGPEGVASPRDGACEDARGAPAVPVDTALGQPADEGDDDLGGALTSAQIQEMIRRELLDDDDEYGDLGDLGDDSEAESSPAGRRGGVK